MMRAALWRFLDAVLRSWGVHGKKAQAIFAAGFLLRVALVFLSEVLDANGLTYSDIDYTVFSEGSREAWEGRSPYDRATFRYTPILAWALVPNVWWPSFGKHVFTLVDMGIALLTLRILTWRGLEQGTAAAFAATFLLHPFAINVSTRGNADSIVCLLVLAVLYFLLHPGTPDASGARTGPGGRRVDAAAVAFGVAVHTKIYPVVFALPLVLFMDHNYAPEDFHDSRSPGAEGRDGCLPAACDWRRVPLVVAAASRAGAPAAVDAGEARGAAPKRALAQQLVDASIATTVAAGLEPSSGGAAAGSAASPAAHGDGTRPRRRRNPSAQPALQRRTAAPATLDDSSSSNSSASNATGSPPPRSAAAAPPPPAPRDDSGARVSLALGRPLSCVARGVLLWAVAAPLALLALAADAGAASLSFALCGGGSKGADVGGGGSAAHPRPPPPSWLAAPSRALLRAALWVADLLTPRRIGFGVLSLSSFAALTAGCYAAYGWTFLWETYLYHLSRADNRHNFSPYFYDLYLRYDQPPDAAGAALSRTAIGLLSLLPQFGTLAALGALFYRDLPAALLLQTWVFVTWNKVVTVQYFHWYLSLLPLALPQSTLAYVATDRRAALTAAALGLTWLITELHWTYYAAPLELWGQATFWEVWGAGLLFFLANVAVLLALVRRHRHCPAYAGGVLTQFPAAWWPPSRTTG